MDILSGLFFLFALLLALLSPLLIPLCAIPLAIGLIIFWITTLMRVIREERGDEKITWVLVVLFLNWIGAVMYVMTHRRPDTVTIYRPKRAPVIIGKRLPTFAGLTSNQIIAIGSVVIVMMLCLFACALSIVTYEPPPPQPLYLTLTARAPRLPTPFALPTRKP